jgi:hypothetical protein
VSIAVARWNLAHVLLSQDGAAAQAEDVARAAVRELRGTPEGRQRTAMEGALELVGVAAAAQDRRWWQARQASWPARPVSR